MDHDDRLIGQVDAGIFFGERRVIPGCNFSLKNSCQRLRRELQFATYARYVIGGYDCAQHGGNMQNSGLGLRELLVGHRSVGSTEVNCSRQHLSNTAADRLIVELNVRVRLVVFTEPLLINGVRESSTRAVDCCLPPSR